MKAKYRYTYFDSTHKFHKIVENNLLEVEISGADREDFHTGSIENIYTAHIVNRNYADVSIFLKRGSITAKDFKAGFNLAQKFLKSLC